MKTTADKIRSDLALGFSDFFVGENVRDTTMACRGTELGDAISMMHAEEAIAYSLLESLGPEHPSAQIYALDFPSDMRASLYLLLGGYYKQAIVCLRNWMEMRLLGIYFGRVDGAKYAAWKLGGVGKEDALYGESFIKKLFSRAEFHKADELNGFRKSILATYGELSVFTHGQGVDKHQLQAETDNVPRYNAKSVDLYLTMMRRAFGEVIYALWRAYGADTFRRIDATTAETVLREVRAEYREELRAPLEGWGTPSGK